MKLNKKEKFYAIVYCTKGLDSGFWTNHTNSLKKATKDYKKLTKEIIDDINEKPELLLVKVERTEKIIPLKRTSVSKG
jgi:hypothetical protein